MTGINDSNPDRYYTLGGRSQRGIIDYFDQINRSFKAVSGIVHRNCVVVQLVGFSNIEKQLPLYLEAVKQAGYKEIFPISKNGERHWREVPNRKWYTNGKEAWDASKEILLFHILAK
jgi:hypothetical protein